MLSSANVRHPGKAAHHAADGPITPAVALRAVGKVFPGPQGSQVEALSGIDLVIAEGEFVCIVGASGCGKSTLLRIIAGFEQSTAGEVLVRGTKVKAPGPDRGFVFQDYGLFPWLTVADNIAYGPRQRGMPKDQVRGATRRYVSMVRLNRFADKYPHQLSGGMQQRVAIARVLANDPAVLLMDEPFGALDALTRQAMQEELRGIWQELRPTVALVTHSVDEAVYLADRVVVMSGGPNHGTPGYVKKIVPIPLEHPRDVTSASFNNLKRDLLAAIHEEGTSTRYLVVANQTLPSAELRERLLALAASDRFATFTLLVPATKPGDYYLREPGHAEAIAQRRGAQAQKAFAAAGLSIAGMVVGDSSPAKAVAQRLRSQPNSYDAIILGTLPEGLSRWAGSARQQIEGKTDLPVITVTAASPVDQV